MRWDWHGNFEHKCRPGFEVIKFVFEFPLCLCLRSVCNIVLGALTHLGLHGGVNVRGASQHEEQIRGWTPLPLGTLTCAVLANAALQNVFGACAFRGMFLAALAAALAASTIYCSSRSSHHF